MMSASRRGISSVCQGAHRVLSVGSNYRLTCRPLSVSSQCPAKKKPTGEEGPIPFSSSKAASWSMTNAVVLPDRQVPGYQSFSIGLSVAVFMIYFLFLREENDLDVELNYSLFERIPQLEEHQLKVVLDYNRRQGIDTLEIEKRLAEIQCEKQAEKEKS